MPSSTKSKRSGINSMSKHLPVEPFRQTASYCGPACLKMVFEYYGLHAEEKKIGKIAGTTHELGTSMQGMKKAVKHFGFDLKVKDGCAYKDIETWLKQGIAPILDWWSETDGHYSVAIGLDKKNIFLQDPELGSVRKIDRQTFYRNWFDFEGDYLKSKNDLFVRRAIIVTPKK